MEQKSKKRNVIVYTKIEKEMHGQDTHISKDIFLNKIEQDVTYLGLYRASVHSIVHVIHNNISSLDFF